MYDKNGKEIVVKKTNKNYAWLEKLYLSSKNDDKILKANGSDCDSYGRFKIGKKIYNVNSYRWNMEKNAIDSIVFHRDCYNLIKDNLDFKLSFDDINKIAEKIIYGVKYPVMNVYMEQFFNFYGAYTEKSWLLMSPLINTNNRYRIYNLWIPIIINKLTKSKTILPHIKNHKISMLKKLLGHN